ncbi:hypothetical protein PSE10C_51950 [Pseudomonas amygdali pv. eriobotryae]|uniref:YD repeat-containing protein n=1 Tax=Pseudomonas amygdali pv. eriobotryae TaxID=129137 RepID=A0A9P3AJ44_PSEA0|nr:hypothetical protein PSE10A_53630 [Pseudomonas amygdali pv. eriobotryae]GFZ74453.1 hypothetical protein PSE10C_51950 [Pseudomonas amygdali pv. eriobotryae]
MINSQVLKLIFNALLYYLEVQWDPDRFLPIKVIEPNRITVYSYDNQGRELTRQSTSR